MMKIFNINFDVFSAKGLAIIINIEYNKGVTKYNIY